MTKHIKKIFITNDIEITKYCDDSGIDIIMIDIETNGKNERQKGMDSVKSNHSLHDIIKLKKVIINSKLMIRINPLYEGTQKEIDTAIEYGVDYIMLPMFKDHHELNRVLKMIEKRAEFIPLLETKEAYDNIDKIVEVKGVYMYHIGLNDLHLSFNLKFMFECISQGYVDTITQKMRNNNIRYGIGGVSRLDTGVLNSNLILSEYYRLGSEMVILSRSFYNYTTNINDIKKVINLKEEIVKLDNFYLNLHNQKNKIIFHNKQSFNEKVRKITRTKDV